jgi:CspA family cold shock protein
MEDFTGTVVWFAKGMGFICPDGKEPNEADIFIHYSDIDMEGFKTLQKDQRVSYQVGKNLRGQDKAVSVKPL